MSSIKINEANILESTHQFFNKQTISYKKSAVPMRKNQLESCQKVEAVLCMRSTQIEEVQQFGEDTTRDIETNCVEFVQLDKSLIDNIEITG
ncbi:MULTISPECIES: hypothetical protein [Listeria]|uniref:hypothetical protein n=1 Tax=Listeria TaxID=1637 RepID=UPI000B58C50B|nr:MULTISPECIES: hypothetical protein [Listeria]